MNGITILIWITIALIGVISIVAVKLRVGGKELENDEKSIIPSRESFKKMLSSDKSSNNNAKQPSSLYPNSTPNTQSNQDTIKPQQSIEIDDNTVNYEYENPNQVLIDYGNEVEKFQEPIKQNQMDIMTQNNNNNDKTELKDLFTIDELIRESKRKDDERDRESKKIDDEGDLTEIKDSIRNPSATEPLIEEIIEEDEANEPAAPLIDDNEPVSEIPEPAIEEEEPISENIADAINEDAEIELDSPTTASQKDIEDVINTASQESDEPIESISDDENITDVLLNADDNSQDIPNEEIKEPTLKTPSKVGENKDYKLGASIDDANLFDDNDDMDLDYRKDLDKITNKIKGSKIFQEVKEKLTPEVEETPEEETYIRNVNEYDEFTPIINETHVDYDNLHVMSADDRLRQENTRRVFNMAKNSPEPELAQPKIESIKDKPARDNIKISLNNNNVVLKPGDEIIYNHLGETYSSQVFAINGDDISVMYRRKRITIKPEDVKKVY